MSNEEQIQTDVIDDSTGGEEQAPIKNTATEEIEVKPIEEDVTIEDNDDEQVQEVDSTQPRRLTQAEINARIDAMYAKLDTHTSKAVSAIEGDDDEEDDVLTKTQLNKLLADREQMSRAAEKFRAAERNVFINHPSMLNDDGSFNMEDKFMKEYVKVGQENPALLTMTNGPELAEAIVEKKLGLSYKKGRVDEAVHRKVTTVDAHTASSTTSAPNRSAAVTGKLNRAEEKVAIRMGLTPEQYIAHRSTTRVQQKDWSK